MQCGEAIEIVGIPEERMYAEKTAGYYFDYEQSVR